MCTDLCTSVTAAPWPAPGCPQAYLQVAPAVGVYPQYRTPLPTHLVTTQLRHWDKALRHLAADALAALVPVLGPTYLATEALDLLLPWCLDAVRGGQGEGTLIWKTCLLLSFHLLKYQMAPHLQPPWQGCRLAR
jgi:hypothetical protein